MGTEELSDEHLEWSDEQCEGCWWCHPRTLSDFIKPNEWRVGNGEPPVDVPDDVDEETITAWDDLSTVQRWMLLVRRERAGDIDLRYRWAMPESKSSSGGSGVATILLVIFVTLKLLNVAPVAQWSWWWVFSPVWIPLCILLAIFVPIMVYKVVANWFGRIREMKRVMEDDQP